MKILFWGSTKSNVGPDNVNKNIRRNLTNSFWSVKSKNRYGELLEGLWKLLFSKVIVVSGLSRKGCIFTGVARMLGKKSIYIIHGCVVYESILNESILPMQVQRQEEYLLKNVDLILPVSQKFMYWMKAQYPEYAEKIKFLYNGIDKSLPLRKNSVEKIPNSVIAAGGNRKQKANYKLAEAIEAMDGRAYLRVYGDLMEEMPHHSARYAKYMGRIENDQFVKELSVSELFVLNSIFETFSVAAVEALFCGCSVLISEAAGITDILELEETDIIHDPMNIEELKEKISYLLEHPNNQRILSKLNIDDWSYEKSVKRLEGFCEELLHK